MKVFRQTVLLSYFLSLAAAFMRTGKSRIPSIGVFDGHTTYSHFLQTRQIFLNANNAENAEFKDSSSRGNSTAVISQRSQRTKKLPFAEIDLLQGSVAVLCVWGRLPVMNGAMSFMLGKGLCLVGVGIMGLAWKQRMNDHNRSSTMPSKLITTGLYAQVRHPFLAGQLVALIGLAGSLKRSAMRYLLAGLYYMVLRKKVEKEEEKLEQKFGHDHQVYKVLVKGRLIPYSLTSKLNVHH